MSELKITLTMDKLHALLIEAADLGADTDGGTYVTAGIAFELVRDHKLLSQTFIEPETADDVVAATIARGMTGSAPLYPPHSGSLRDYPV